MFYKQVGSSDMQGCQAAGEAGEWVERESEGREQVSACAADSVYTLLICVHPCACKYFCVCVHEHADVYTFLRSNAHSQMKSSNVSARKPQMGSHGS